MDRERFEKQLNFILEIDKEKQILRQTHIRGYSRQEDDAEHAWHMALFVMVLSEYANEDIDVLKTMKIVLIHDLIEIYAGDTYAYDSKGNESKRGRELAAADRLFNILPKDQAEEFRNSMKTENITVAAVWDFQSQRALSNRCTERSMWHPNIMWVQNSSWTFHLKLEKVLCGRNVSSDH